MKRKIICLGVISLFLMTGFFSYSVGANSSDTSYVPSQTVEQNTPVVKSAEGDSKINIFGGLRVHIWITPDESVQNQNYHFSCTIKFNDELTLRHSGIFESHKEKYSTVLLFFLRKDFDLNSRSGSVEVNVKIYPENELPIQEVTRTGTFSGPFVTFN